MTHGLLLSANQPRNEAEDACLRSTQALHERPRMDVMGKQADSSDDSGKNCALLPSCHRSTSQDLVDEPQQANAEAGNDAVDEGAEKAAHRSLSLHCLGLGAGLLALRLAPQSGLHAISDTPRKVVRPLVHRLVCDANRLGGGGYRSAEKFDGFGFTHAPLNHSSRWLATIVTTEDFYRLSFNHG